MLAWLYLIIIQCLCIDCSILCACVCLKWESSLTLSETPIWTIRYLIFLCCGVIRNRVWKFVISNIRICLMPISNMRWSFMTLRSIWQRIVVKSAACVLLDILIDLVNWNEPYLFSCFCLCIYICVLYLHIAWCFLLGEADYLQVFPSYFLHSIFIFRSWKNPWCIALAYESLI